MNIYGVSYDWLVDFLLEHGEKKYRALQIFSWLYEKRVASFDEMTNLSKSLISLLKESFVLSKLRILKKEEDINVKKYLFLLPDGECIESVLMVHDYGLSLCISSQVGCNMGCRFCESGRRKKVRNLNASEMILQILAIEEDIKMRISHVVVMGIGEPLDNYDEIVRFLEIANFSKGLAIGSRHITVSTCGIIPKLKEFSLLPFQVNLAISLHAPNDLLRSSLMPINKVYPIHELIEAVKEYIKKTNRRVTFEYILLDGVNDQEKDAKELCKLLKGILCYVNLIPYNESSAIEYKRSTNEQIKKFYDIIKNEGITVTIRKEFGSKISAACGQLRSKKEDK